MSELVHYTAERGVAVVTLDSPDNRNALSRQLVTELTARLDAATEDDSVRAVVLTHTGGTFCAGADLREQSSEGGPAQGTERMLTLLRTVVDLPVPVIARVDGHVRAGGLGLVGACDLAVAGPRSTFAFTEVRLGLTPAIISLTTLGRLTERGAARYYLTGETFDATTAAAIGLLTAAADDLDAAVTELTDALRACSPQGLRETKRLTTRTTRAAFEAHASDVQELSARLFASDEARVAMTAFLQKQPPPWAVR